MDCATGPLNGDINTGCSDAQITAGVSNMHCGPAALDPDFVAELTETKIVITISLCFLKDVLEKTKAFTNVDGCLSVEFDFYPLRGILEVLPPLHLGLLNLHLDLKIKVCTSFTLERYLFTK